MQRSQLIPVFGMLVVIGVAAVEVSKLAAQGIPAGLELSRAVSVELRDASGRVVLRGQFADMQGDADEQERHAALGPAGDDADAAGEVEVEAEQTAVTYRRMPPDTGGRGGYGHRHRTQEEIYLVIAGHLTFKLGDEIVDAGPGTAVRVGPETVRSVHNDSDDDAREAVIRVATEDGADNPGDEDAS